MAGLLLGVLESFSIWVLPAAYKDVIAISILMLILFVRPTGLFGNAEVARLKDY
jgi:branched-chain amino acid transport system permease protein